LTHSLSIVIPVYRSELIIPLLIQRLTNVLEGDQKTGFVVS